MQNTQIQATKDHCIFCFDVLVATFDNKNLPKFPENLPYCEVPVFVTLHIDQDELRGCIGTFSPDAIDKQLTRYTLSSAFQDHRFSPLQKAELQNLDIGVSFLINFEKNKKWDQWEVGKHGIIINFSDGKRGELFKEYISSYLDYQATFLPEVAAEQKWDKPTTLRHLISKAGYRKNPDEMFNSIILTTYESSKAKITYQEYLEVKQNK